MLLLCTMFVDSTFFMYENKQNTNYSWSKYMLTGYMTSIFWNLLFFKLHCEYKFKRDFFAT